MKKSYWRIGLCAHIPSLHKWRYLHCRRSTNDRHSHILRESIEGWLDVQSDRNQTIIGALETDWFPREYGNILTELIVMYCNSDRICVYMYFTLRGYAWVHDNSNLLKTDGQVTQQCNARVIKERVTFKHFWTTSLQINLNMVWILYPCGRVDKVCKLKRYGNCFTYHLPMIRADQ